MANVNVKVSIPVTKGGYTGQRDAWESLERDQEVTLGDDGVVTLTDDRKNSISFVQADLEAALAFLKNGAAKQKPGPVYREPKYDRT